MKKDILTFDEKELFNSEILQQYDNDGQRVFAGYLIRHEKWTIEGGEIRFPEINSKEKVQKLLQDYDTDVKKFMLQIIRQDLSEASVFGLDGIERKIERINKEIRKNERATQIDFTEHQGDKERKESNSNYTEVLEIKLKMYRGKDAIQFLEDLGAKNACSITLAEIENIAVPTTVIYLGEDKIETGLYRFYSGYNNIFKVSKEDFMKGIHVLSNYRDMEKAMLLHKQLRIQEKNKDCR